MSEIYIEVEEYTMSFKIRNYKLAGLEVVFSTETVVFDVEGIAELESESTYYDALNMRNFYRVVEGELATDPDIELEDPNADPTIPTPPASIAKAVRAREAAIESLAPSTVPSNEVVNETAPSVAETIDKVPDTVETTTNETVSNAETVVETNTEQHGY